MPFSGPSPYGLSPMQIRHAYGFDQVTLPGTFTIADGSGETIAIVDAYNSPNIRTDLAAFSQQFGLANPTSDQFKIVSQTGSTTNLPPIDPGGPGAVGSWDLETSLDVEITHALAPGANILLVEASSGTTSDLQAAADFARRQAGVVVVSMSWGYGEMPSQTATDGTFTTPSGHDGVTFIAATGDSGVPSFYPAYSPNVIAAGGTTLSVDGSGNILSETGWSGSGGGVSAVESQPAYQNGIVSQYSMTKRTAPDVAFDGDPTTGASIYDSYDYGTATPWVKVGGTSLSAPGWASLIAIADQARASVGLGSLDGPTQTLPMLYSFNQSDFNDITAGNNGSPAGPGYDLVTGRGTPRAVAIVNDLVGAFHVAGSNPAAGAAVPMPPTDFAITFSSPYSAANVAASSFTVNSIAADSFTLTDATTITFQFNASPVTTQGLQTMAIAAGSFARQADGAPLSAFSGSFRYDATPIAIDATTPTDHSIVTVPFSSLTVHFNEAFAATTIGTSNLTLSQGSVAGFSIIDSQTVQYTLAGVNAPGTLSISMAAGAATDIYGNPGPAYSGTIFLNGTTTAFPTPMAQVKPAGSLIYQGAANGSVLFAGNTVSYSLAVAAGQNLSVNVVPVAALEPQITVAGPGVNVTASAPAAGTAATIQTIPIVSAGTYTFTVSGLNGTNGNYQLTTDLNAAVSTSTSGGGNHTLAAAQDIDSGFATLAGTSQRAAVISPSAAMAGPNNFGYAGVAISSPFDDISTTGTPVSFISPAANLPTQLGPSAPSGISFPFYGNTYNTVFLNPHGLIVLTRISATGTNTDLSSAPTTAAIAPLWDNITVSGAPASAVYYKLEPTAAGNRLVIEWSHVSFVGGPQTGQVTFEAILGSDGTIVLNYLNLDPSLTRSGDPGATIGIKNSNTAGADPLVVASPTLSNSLIASGSSIEIARNIVPAVSDYYAFTLGSGQTTTVAVAGLNSAAVHVTLVDGQGNPLAAGSAPGSGSPITEAINNYSGPAGTYYALVTGAPGAAYSLIVTRDAALGAGNNASFAAAQDITATKGALGAINASAPENWFSINLAAGTPLSLQTYTPGGTASQLVNNLDPVIELYSSADVLLASGQGSRNQTLVTTIATSGVYRIRVRSADMTTGEYFLSVDTSATPPQITGVYLSGGAAWSPAFYSYLFGHGLGDNQLGYSAAGGASQLLSLPWSNVTTISVVFTQDVMINTAAGGLALVGSPDLPGAPSLAGASFIYNSATHTATWVFSAPLTDDKYLLNIPSSAVANQFGQSLDGEWATGSSNFPSGDGAVGGDFAFRFNLLPADVDQNGVVTGVDGNAVRNRLLEDTTVASYSPFADVNGDGAITSQDGSLVRMHLLDALPQTDPLPPAGGSAVPVSTTAVSEIGDQRSEIRERRSEIGLLQLGQTAVSEPLATLSNGATDENRAAQKPAPKLRTTVLSSLAATAPRSSSLPRRMLRAADLAARDLVFELLGNSTPNLP
jgi:hypothetical protein